MVTWRAPRWRRRRYAWVRPALGYLARDTVTAAGVTLSHGDIGGVYGCCRRFLDQEVVVSLVAIIVAPNPRRVLSARQPLFASNAYFALERAYFEHLVGQNHLFLDE